MYLGGSRLWFWSRLYYAVRLSVISIKNILQPILSHTLFQKDLTGRARLGAHESIKPDTLSVLGQPHDIHIGTPKLRNVAQVLDDIALGVNRVRRPTGSAAAAPHLVRRLGNHLSALYQHRHMNTRRMGLS